MIQNYALAQRQLNQYLVVPSATRSVSYLVEYIYNKPIYLSIRSKQKVFYDLLHGVKPILFVRWLLTSFRGSHACSFFSCSTAEMSFSLSDIYYDFNFKNGAQKYCFFLKRQRIFYFIFSSQIPKFSILNFQFFMVYRSVDFHLVRQ